MTTSIRPRRIAALVAALLSATLILSGCGSSEDSDRGSSSSPSESYPVTIDTAYGEITLDKKPERIVVLDGAEVDMLAAIGEQPVAFTADGPRTEHDLTSDFPWLEGLYTGEFDPKLINAEYKASAEAFAAHDPDLILGRTAFVDEKLYGQLSQIAPTFVGTEKDRATTLDDYMKAIGTLTGKTKEASKVLADLDAEFAQARERLSGLQGKTYNDVAYRGEQFFFGGRSYVLNGIGMEPAGNQVVGVNAGAPVSLENIDQLAADILMIGAYHDPTSQPNLEADPRFPKLPASENGTVMFTSKQQTNAMYIPGPSSISWVLKQIVPQLEKSKLNTSGK